MGRFRGAAVVVLGLLLAASQARSSVDIDLEGLDGPLRDNARAVLSIARAADDAPDGLIRRLHARAPDEIRTALQPFGYYQPTIEASLEPDGENWRARYVVTAGPQVMVASVDVQVRGDGGDDPGFQAVVTGFPVVLGAPLSHADYDLGKRRLLSHAARKGYFDAVFDSSAILVTVGEDRADVVLYLDSGPRYSFGPVTIVQDVLHENRVTGYVTIEPGQPYDVEPLVRMQNELSSTPYFEAVEIRTQKDQAEDLMVPIELALSPARTQRYEVGFGYGTDTGFRGKLVSQWRRLNRSGHHAEMELQASQVEYSASARYIIPWPYPRTEVLTFFGTIGHVEPRWASSWRTALGANLGRSRRGWREIFSLAWESERFTVAGEDGRSSLVIPGISWTRVRADDPIFPNRGYRLRFDARGALDQILSSTTFGQLWAEGKAIRTLAPHTRVLARATAARTFTDSFNDLPPTHRFVTGGDQTVRGYAFESLGPVDSRGDIVGGDSLLLGSLELEYLFIANFGIAAFVDTGNALVDFAGSLAVGAGGGLRWISPIGIVRLDLGVGLSEEGDPVRLHLAIGPDL